MSLVLCISIEIIMVVMTLLCAASDEAKQQDDADKIVERSVEVLKRDWAAQPRFDCSERDKDKNGIRTYEDIMLDGSQYQKLIALNDRPLDAHQQSEQEQKFQEAAAKRRSESESQKRRRIARYEADRKRQGELITELTKAFTFTLASTDKLDGRDVYLLNAEPRKGYRPPSVETRVLTGMRGKVWIERDNTEDGVAPELVQAGIPKSQIVLAFRSPEVRKHTEYAVA